MPIGLRTLVLNADMTPISIFPLHSIPTEDAVTRCLNGTCFVVAEYDRRILTQHTVMHWPSVIAKKDYIRLDRFAPLKHETLFYRDNATCAYCGQRLFIGVGMSVDHVIPLSKGGQDRWNNVVAACRPCNQAKGNQLPVGRWKPKHKPYIPTYWSILKQRRKFPIAIGHSSWLEWLGDWEAKVTVVKRY